MVLCMCVNAIQKREYIDIKSYKFIFGGFKVWHIVKRRKVRMIKR